MSEADRAMSSGRATANVDDPARLAVLADYAVLDTPAEPGFDDIVLLATQICSTPVALVSLVAGDRQWFKARIGFDPCQTPLDQSICRHGLAQPGLLVIPDLTADPRTRDNSLVTGEPHLRFYAGARLETPEGFALGTLCVIDPIARPDGLTPAQAKGLEALARQVMSQLELRRIAAARDAALGAVREADVRRRQILDSATDYAIIATDRAGRVTEWNTGAEAIFGWSAHEMIGEPADRFFVPEDRETDRIEREMRRSLESGRGNDERWHLRKDGSRFWANGEMMPLRDAAGGHQGFLKIVRDETARREAAEKLRLSEEFLRSVLASSNDGIEVLDLDARVVFMSEGGRRVMEVEDFEAIRGRPWLDLWRGDHNAAARAAVASARAGGVGTFQGAAETVTGTPRWWDVQVTPILDGAGQPEKLLAISRDITEARAAAETLREAQSLNTLILNSSADCIVVLDLDGNTEVVSPGGIEAMEVTDLAGIIGLSWLRVWAGPDQEAARAAVAAARAGSTGRFQGYCPTHKGAPRWWDVAVSPLPGVDGRPERLVTIGRDITASKLADQRLARSDERLALALGASGMVGVWDWDLKADVIYADANFARIYTVDPAWAAQGAPLSEYIKNFHPDDLPGFEAELTRLFAGAEEFVNEYRILQPDGSVRWVLARGRLVRGADGTPERFPGASVDITERKEAETRRLALLDLGDRLRDLTDPTTMAFAAAESMGRTLDATRAGYGTVDEASETIAIERDWTGSGAASIAGLHAFRDFGSFVDDLKHGIVVEIADTALDPRTAAHTTALDRIGVRSILNLPVFEHGRFVALFFIHGAAPRNWSAEQTAFVRNVADRTRAAIERRHAENSLRELNDDLERRVAARTRERNRVWETTNDLMATADLDGCLREVNPAWTQLLGWTEADLLAKPFLDLVDPAHRPATARALGRLAAGETVTGFVDKVRRKDGIERTIVWSAVPEGGLFYVVGRDLTEQRQIEEQLRQSQKMEAVGQLTGGVAHDFNNLLTVIRSSVDLLKRPGLAEQRRVRYVEAIADATTRAARLTGQLLAFARRQALQPETFDVVHSIRSMGDMVVTLTGTRIRIVVEAPEAGCFIHADPSQFDTVLVNLAVNARDAMNGEGQLRIAVRAVQAVPALRAHAAVAGDFVAVSMSDTGSGIAPADLDRIFEPFFTTKGVGQGTGLGLSQVFGFVKQSGGEVAVESTPGRGTTFTLYLPRVAPGAAEPREHVGGEPLIDGHGCCVLVVEDNAAVGSFATQSLQELGYATILAVDAPDALAQLVAGADRFDVVFSDVVMPGMNGIDLAQAIRQQFPGMPVVLTSGYSHVLATEGTHGFDLLHKPYSVEDLSRALRRAITARARPASA